MRAVMDSIEILTRAGMILSEQTAWTKNAYVRDQKARPMQNLLHHDACRFSIIGAITHVQGVLPENPKRAQARCCIDLSIIELFPERAVVPHHETRSIPFFNDHPDTKHEDVVAVMRLALLLAKDHQRFIHLTRSEKVRRKLFLPKRKLVPPKNFPRTAFKNRFS